MTRPPLSVRLSGDPESGWEGPYPGVPLWLMPSLLAWIRDSFYSFSDDVARLQRRLHLELDWRSPNLALESALVQMEHDPELALDIVDWGAEGADGERLMKLRVMLQQAGSVFTVGLDEEGRGQLVYRVDPTVTAAVKESASPGTNSATHLATAWSRIYRRDPDPSAGYSAAVKAVESAAIPVVAPKHSKATLGTVIGELKAHREKWVVILNAEQARPEIEVVIGMLDLFWAAQEDRHVRSKSRRTRQRPHYTSQPP